MNRKCILSCLYVLVGIAFMVLGIAERLDSFWSGMGGGLVGVGAVQLYRFIRYSKDAVYKEAVDIAKSDERNGFITGKAMCWAGYLFVMIVSVGTIVFRVAGKNDLSKFCGFAVCLMLVLYWLSYLIVRKKY